MKFSEEYKKSAENMNPDRQTIDRMKAAVLKELQEHPDAPAQPLEEPKKPLPLRRIAYIGGAVALTWGALWQAVSIPMQRTAASADLIFLVILMIPVLSLFPRRGASSRPPSQSLPGAYPAFRTEPIRRPSGRQGQR